MDALVASIRDAWDSIEARRALEGSDEMTVASSGISTSHGDVLVAVDTDGLRHLLAPVDPTFSASADDRSGGVSLSIRELDDRGTRKRFVDLACRHAHLNSVFADMVLDASRELSRDASEPYAACSATLARWRELIERAGPRLGKEELAGLFAELWHLRELARVDLALFRCWRGSDLDPHDFRNGNVAIEVKATMSRSRWRLRIHGHKQLDPVPAKTLVLSAMQVAISGAGSQTVPSVVRELCDLGVDRRELLEKLVEIGYLVGDEHHYELYDFVCVARRAFLVDYDFPRIVAASFAPSDLPAGTSNLSYDIELGTNVPGEIMELHRVLQLLAEG